MAHLGTTYLLHFERPYHHARHYIGFTPGCVSKRVEKHRRGVAGAVLTRAAAFAGIDMQLARIWPGTTRHDERRLKRQRAAKRMCPVCNPNNGRNPTERRSVSKPTTRGVVMT